MTTCTSLNKFGMEYAQLHKGEMASLQSANGDLSAHVSYVSADCHSPPSKNQYRSSIIASVNYNQSRSVLLGLVKCGHQSRATYERPRLRQKQALLEICFIPFGTPSFYQTSRSKNVPSPAHIFFVCQVQQLLLRQFLNVGSLKIQACLVYREDVDCAQSIWLQPLIWIIKRLLQAL